MPQRKPQLGANGRDEFSPGREARLAATRSCVRSEETLQNVEPLARQNTFASFGPARNLKHNNVPISGGGVFPIHGLTGNSTLIQ